MFLNELNIGYRKVISKAKTMFRNNNKKTKGKYLCPTDLTIESDT